MTAPRGGWAALAGALVLLAGCEASREDPDGVERVALDQAEYPCELEFEPMGAVVESDSAGAYPDPSPWLSRGADGRLYASTALGGHIVRFGPAGEFERTIGRPGEGPGELGNGVSARATGDTLHVLDPSLGRWNRFTLDGRFLSSGTSRLFRGMTPGNYEIIGRDSLLTAGSPGLDESQFHVVDAEGEAIRAFGARDQEPRPNTGSMALGPGRTFWVAPEQGADEYLLQEWSYDGRLLRRLERRAPWFERIREGESYPDEAGQPQIPAIMHPFAGPNGQLVVGVYVTDGPVGDLVEAWYEVIDPERGMVLASRRVPANGEIQPMFRTSPPGPLGTRATVDDNDLYRIELVRYTLRPRAGTSDGDRACTT